MKKQILILILFVAAIVAGTSKSYGQYDVSLSALLDSCLTPVALDCDSASALRPAPGEWYTYEIESIDYDNTGNEKVHWFVVDYNDFSTDSLINTMNDITHLPGTYIDPGDGTGEFLLDASSSYNVDFATPVSTSDTVQLQWQYFDGQANVVLLVAYVEDEAGCTDNIEVYRIIPEPAFTLDIAGIDQTDNSFVRDTATPASECVSPIESAWYTPAANPASPGDGMLTVDYGENWLYFVVNAANFVDSWDPTFDFSYDGLGTITSAAWTYPAAVTNAASSAWHTIDIASGATDYVVGGGGDASGASIDGQGDGTSVGPAGECIVVRVQVDHGTLDENIVTRRLTVRVNGIMYDPAQDALGNDPYLTTTLADFGPDDNGDGACDQVLFDDVANYDITPRPDVNEVDPTPFEQKTPEN